jgi:hypothetical protein
MVARVLCTVLGLTLLTGCGLGFGDLYADARSYFSADGSPPGDPRLTRILSSAADTPGHQGFLYVAMVEAQVASQYAGYALAANDLATAKNAIGDVLYAIDPGAAPSWQARSAGVVQAWAGKGYGLRRAVRNLQSEVRALAAADPSAQGPARVAACTDTMLARADRIVALGQQVLAANEMAGLRPTLEQIDGLARELYYGTATLETDQQTPTGCGLQEARLLLQAMVPATA